MVLGTLLGLAHILYEHLFNKFSITESVQKHTVD